MKVFVVVLVCAAVFGLRGAGAVSPEDARIIAAVSTWTQLSFVTSTTTVAFTCKLPSAAATVACKRRSIRQYTALSGKFDESSVDLDSSLMSDEPVNDPSVNDPSVNDPFSQKVDGDATPGSDREERLALTVWSSATSTYTMIMTATNNAVTFSVSYFCTVAGVNYPPNC